MHAPQSYGNGPYHPSVGCETTLLARGENDGLDREHGHESRVYAHARRHARARGPFPPRPGPPLA